MPKIKSTTACKYREKNIPFINNKEMLLLSHLCSWLGPLCHSICPEHSQYNVSAGTGQYWAGRCQWDRGRGSPCPPDSSVPSYSSHRTTDQSDSVLWMPAGSSDRPHTCQQGRSVLQINDIKGKQ